ncbi:Hypothetical_protein [Hexamita inflata]|uniref:Hypothetical_protein n=1 Tax=Hexamita inflata TaxID=28002 RepID=A0ABP1H4T1_9EUKA
MLKITTNSQKQQRILDDRPLGYVETVQSSFVCQKVQLKQCGVQVQTPQNSCVSLNKNYVEIIDVKLVVTSELQINESSESKQIFCEDENLTRITRIATITANMKLFDKSFYNYPQKFDEEISLVANRNQLTLTTQLQQQTSAVSKVNKIIEWKPSTSNNKPKLTTQNEANYAKMKLELEIMQKNADLDLDIKKQIALIENNAKIESKRIEQEHELKMRKMEIQMEIMKSNAKIESKRIEQEHELKMRKIEIQIIQKRIELKNLKEDKK